MAVIKTEHLSHVYSEGTPFVKMAIQDVNLSIEEGEMVGVIGHTGSGKSTLIQHLNGLLKPTSGKIYIDGQDMWEDKTKLRDIRFKVGLVFQYPEYQLFEETVYKDISFGPRNMGLSEEEIDRRVREAAAFVSITEDLLQKSPFELSGGQKRRVAIAGVLAMQPQCVVLDEPTAMLDPQGRREVLDTIERLNREKGITVILITHHMDEAVRAGRVIAMSEGKIIADGTPQQVFAQEKLLRSVGLDVPQTEQLLLALRARGVDIPTDALTPAQCARLLRQYIPAV